MKVNFKFIFIFLIIILPLLFIIIFINGFNLSFLISNKNYSIEEKKILIADEKEFENILAKKEKENNINILQNFKEYLIKWGDTLLKIKRKFKLSKEQYKKLIEINNIEDEDLIISGKKLKIPLNE